MKKQFRIAHLAFALCLSATAASQSVASCAISSGVMTCTVSTTNDTVDSTGLPANAASLRDAIIQVNSVAPPPAGQTHIINLPASFVGTPFRVTLFKFLPPIWNDVTINGNGNMISGNNVAITGAGFDTRLFIVGSSGEYFPSGTRVTLKLNDLTLRDGVARGGTGAGGGLGAGGAIFITSNGDVTTRNVKFTGNWAVGGAGVPAGSPIKAGGGMGGNGGELGGGGWGGNGQISAGGLGGDGEGNSGDYRRLASGGGGLNTALIGATTTLRGAAIPAAGSGSWVGDASANPGQPRGGGGGAGCFNPAATQPLCAALNAAALSPSRPFGKGMLSNANVNPAAMAGGGGGAGGVSASVTGSAHNYVVRPGGGGFGGGSGASQSPQPSNAITDFTQATGGFGGGGLSRGGFGGGGARDGGFGGGAHGGKAGFGAGGLTPGFGGGAAGLTFNGEVVSNAGFGGGAGFGGAVFLDDGGSLTLGGGSQITAGAVIGGAGGAGTHPGRSGKACGVGIFAHAGGERLRVAPDAGEVVTLEDGLADTDCSGNVSPRGVASLVKVGAGALILSGDTFLDTVSVQEGTLRFSNVNGAAAFRVFAFTNDSIRAPRIESDGTGIVVRLTLSGGGTLAPGSTQSNGLFAVARQRVGVVAPSGDVVQEGRLVASVVNGLLPRFEMHLGDANVFGDLSRLEVYGAVQLGGAVLDIRLRPGVTPTIGATYDIIDYSGDPLPRTTPPGVGSNIFAGLPEATEFRVGEVTYRINYNFENLKRVRLTVTDVRRTPALSLSSSLNPSRVGDIVTFSAVASGLQGTPTGSVTFNIGAQVLGSCTAVTLVAGAANCSAAINSLGSQDVVAHYSGDATYYPVSSVALTQAVSASPPGALSSIDTLTGTDANGVGFITFTVGAPANNGGSPITGYTARCTNSLTHQVLSTTVNAATLTLTLSPASVGQSYNCSVFASNAIGDGPATSGSATAFASLNIDGSTATIYDAATDGVMILRYMTGIRGDAISDGVIGATATRTATQIATYLATIQTQLDIDGDGAVNATTDGALIVRHMRGMSLSSSYIMNVFNPTGLRGNEDDITSYLARMMP